MMQTTAMLEPHLCDQAMCMSIVAMQTTAMLAARRRCVLQHSSSAVIGCIPEGDNSCRSTVLSEGCLCRTIRSGPGWSLAFVKPSTRKATLPFATNGHSCDGAGGSAELSIMILPLGQQYRRCSLQCNSWKSAWPTWQKPEWPQQMSIESVGVLQYFSAFQICQCIPCF